MRSFEKELCGISGLRRFGHEAMAASFEVFVIHEDSLYAEQAAYAAFEGLDRIETDLSRFIENSDVSRINSLGKGRPLQIGLSTFECLQIGLEMFKQTNGAFDVTFGSLQKGRVCYAHQSSLKGGHSPPYELKLDESKHTVELLDDGIKIDLGGIGKGYAADKMGQLLGEWGIDTALISAGQSTVLPIGAPAGLPGWPVSISDPADYSRVLAKVHLVGRALSASGIHKRSHIINPRSGKPATGKLAAWATAKTAAVADALSTTFMVMAVDEVRAFCEADANTSAIIIPKGKKRDLLRFGRWESAEFYI
jgi:thiamine biosynthesis lipoprotein